MSTKTRSLEQVRDVQLNDLQLCYFAALIHGLRIIDEKARDLKLDPREVEVDAGALIHFVRVKGDQLVKIHFGNTQNLQSSLEDIDQTPTPRPRKEIPPVVGKKRRSKYYFAEFPRKLAKSELAEIEQIVLDRQSV